MGIARHAVRYSICCGLAALSAGLAAQPALAQTRTYQIKETSLSKALRDYARASGRQIILTEDLVRGKRAPAVAGSYSADDALDRLLAGSGLRAERTPAGAIMIVKVGNGQTAADGGVAMGEEENLTQNGEIIVTAQKRQERLIDVPQSIAVITANDLSRLAATQFRDFADTVPGLSFTSSGAGQTQLTLRGITTGQDVGATVGVYVDDVPYGSSSNFANGGQFALDVGLFDVDRVEVLRGPQGTLYGASTMGGLLKYVSKRPDPSRFGGEARASLSNTRFGGTNYDLSAAINTPIVGDRVAMRASGFYARDGGYIDNLALGARDVNRSEIYGGRIDFLMVPTERLTVRINGFLQDIKRDGNATSDYRLTGGPREGSLTQRRPMAEPFDQHFRLASAALSYDLDGATLTSISSYQSMKSVRSIDLTEAFVPILSAFFARNYSGVSVIQGVSTKKFTQELRLGSKAGSSLEWLVGGFYTHEKTSNTQIFGLTDLTGNTAVNDVYDYSGPSRFSEFAGFADFTYHLTSRFDASVGVRYAHSKQSFTQIGSGLLIGSLPTQRAKDNVATYLANARYHVNERSTLYVRYATGYRPGGPNFVSNDPTTGLPLGPTVFGADKLSNYEIGFKSETANRTFGVDVAAFYIDWSNIQILVSRGGFSGIANAPGGATVRGAEITLLARPVRGLVFNGAFAYQDAHLSKADPDLGGRAGETLPNVSRYSASLNGEYQMLDVNYQPSIGATLRFVSKRNASFDDAVGFLQYHLPSYVSLDVRAGIKLGPIEARLFVRNLTDKRAQQSAVTNRGPAWVAMAQPRTIGVGASTSF